MNHAASLSVYYDRFDQVSGFAFDPDLVLKRFLEWFPNSTVEPDDYHVARAKKSEDWANREKLPGIAVPTGEWRMVARESPAILVKIRDPETGFATFHIRRHSIGFYAADPISSVLFHRLTDFLRAFSLPEIQILSLEPHAAPSPGQTAPWDRVSSLSMTGNSACFVFETNLFLERVVQWFPDAIILRNELGEEEIRKTEALMERLGVTDSKLGTTIWKELRFGPYATPTIELEFRDAGEDPVHCLLTPKKLSFTFENTNRVADIVRQKIMGFLKIIALPDVNVSTHDT